MLKYQLVVNEPMNAGPTNPSLRSSDNYDVYTPIRLRSPGPSNRGEVFLSEVVLVAIHTRGSWAWH